MRDEDIPLQKVEKRLLDDAAVEQLFAEIAERGTLFEILVKGGETERAARTEQPSLDEVRKLLLERRVIGVQLRYGFGDTERWDTLMQTKRGIRLVRVQGEPPR